MKLGIEQKSESVTFNPKDQIITVIFPLLPPLEEFIPYLEDIWGRKWLTNNGYNHQKLEKALASYLNLLSSIS